MTMQPQVEGALPPQAGWYDGLDGHAYHSGPGWSSTNLKAALQSPSRAYYSYNGGSEPTHAMRLGTLRHLLLLEPHLFSKTYVVRPENMDGRTKDGREWLAYARESGKDVVTHDEYENALDFAARVRRHPLWEGLVGQNPHHVERSWYWNDSETGVLCKARTDLVVDLGERVAVLDLKSTSNATPEAFSRQAYNLGYHLSAAHYSAGVQTVTGKPVDFILIAAEYDSPYDVEWYLIGRAGAQTRQMMLGEQERQKALQVIARCERDDDWPSATAGRMTELALPAWAERHIDYDQEPF